MKKRNNMQVNYLYIKDRKAIKTHKCAICKSNITAREVYTVSTMLRLGKGFLEIKSCLFHSIKDILNSTKRNLKKHERRLLGFSPMRRRNLPE